MSDPNYIMPMAFSELERFRQLVLVALLGSLAILVLDLVSANWLGLAGMFGVLLGVAAAWLSAKSGRVGLATHLLAGVLLLGITHMIWCFGGTQSGMEQWLLTPFLAVIVTRDVRASIPWGLAVIPAAALLTRSPHPELTPWARYAMGVIYMVQLAVGLGIFVRAKLLVNRRLSQANEALAREVEQRRIAEARARKMERAQAEFLATMSHEIRTPLNGVLAMTELLNEAELPPAQARQVGVLHQSGTVLMRVVSEVLDLSKLEAGLISLDPQPVQLGPLVQSTVALHRPSAQSKGLALEVASFLDVPPWVLMDGTRLQQALGNLLHNAIQCTEKGGIIVGIAWAEGRLDLSVTDSGPGISKQAQESIFERYRAANASKTGTGLGLAIVWQICKTMGGRVEVESQLGQGSTFLCALPAPSCPAPPAVRAPGPLRLLVVDDQAINRDMLRLLLESRGHRVFVVSSGQEALELLRGGGLSLDLMICDLHMPGMTGWDLVATWREVEAMEALPRLPVLGLTASIVDGEHAQALASGMDQIVTKPVRADALQDVVQELARG